MYKKIIIGKISDHGGEEKTPTHVLKVQKDTEKPITVGKLWTRTGEYGKFLSGVMQDEFRGEKGVYLGYVIVEENYIKKLKEKIKELEGNIPEKNEDSDFNKPTTYTDENGVEQEIPF